MFRIALVLNVPNWQRSEVSISSKPVFINDSIIITLLSPCSAMDERNHNTEKFPNEDPKKNAKEVISSNGGETKQL